jgi:hypothetical protein
VDTGKGKIKKAEKPSVGLEKVVLSKLSLLRNILISTILLPKSNYDVTQILNFSNYVLHISKGDI